ncbi:MAG: lipoprotein [Gammaproteobacteria bacterium]|nr:lipoprotein [Gammaproteobacteria bacterium]MCY4165615.1 lipoprotein [Gammaproteobacteria bacterium]MCY4340141.1 lipoprotein [Gammaproteobacteria bacterium]
MAPIDRKGTLADVLAHLRNVVLALVLSGCGFSGALYLPEEPPPAPEEQRPASEERPPHSAGDQPGGPPA